MTKEEALGWVASLFEEEVEDISLDTPREEIPAWDSLGTLTLMAGLDEEFDIQLDENQIAELRSVGDVVAILNGEK
jgi:acyl carrier protein